MRAISNLILLTLFVFQSPVNAQVTPDNLQDKTEASANCIDCSRQQTTPAGAALKIYQDAFSVRDLRNALGLGGEEKAASDAIDKAVPAGVCDKFAGDGKYGHYGDYIATLLNSGNYDHLMQATDDIRRVCPGYDKMNDDQKIGMWVVAGGAMGFGESSCDQNTPVHQGPNGQLKCLFQLDKGNEKIYAPGCHNNDSMTAETCIRCTFSMLDLQVKTKDVFFGKKAYWEVLRPNEKREKIISAIKSYAFCK